MRKIIERNNKAAELLIKNNSLVINGRNYEIVGVSVHASSDGFHDPLVMKDGSRKGLRWFFCHPNEKSYIRFVDLNITACIDGIDIYGGIRINSIKNEVSGLIGTAGEVYDHIMNQINIQDVERYSYIKQGKIDTPKLYLSRNPQKSVNIISLPRFGQFSKVDIGGEKQMSALFENQLFTTDLEWIKKDHSGYSQYYPVLLSLYFQGYEEFILENKLITKNLLKKCLDDFERGQKKPIYQMVDKRRNRKSMCELYGFFYDKMNPV